MCWDETRPPFLDHERNIVFLSTLRRLLEMIRFSHTLFALPFALFSAILAWDTKQAFQWIELAGILLAMVCARSAAMAFNRLVDRHIDVANPRTAGRHLPSGQLGVGLVWAFTAVCSLGFVGSTALFVLTHPPNYWPLILSVPVLFFLGAYSLTKRFTALAHLWLGVSLMLAPLAAWIAIRGMEDLLAPLLLSLAVAAWVTGFDIIYACQDVDFDRGRGLHSVPARLGIGPALRMALGCHVLMMVLLLALYFAATPPLGAIYLIGLAVVGGLLGYEHSLVTPTNLGRVNQAFFHVNALISIGLLMVLLVEIIRTKLF
jgi:4-hydroxybenzoate polyprenyltransferase